MAAEQRRPVLSPPARYLDVSPSDLRTNLKYWANLAHRWKASLLIEDAEETLSSKQNKRDSTPAARLAILSTFLETCWIPVVLTTNQPDPMKSVLWAKASLRLYYPPLSDDARTQIWRNVLQDLTSTGSGFAVSDAAMEYPKHNSDVHEMKLNGHDITNVLNTAVSLLRAEAEDRVASDEKDTVELVLEERHISMVMENLKAEREYMLDSAAQG